MSDDRRAFFRGLMRSAAEMTGPPPAPPEQEATPAPPEDPDALTAAEVDRYSRQLVLPEWSERAQLAVRDAGVLVVGAGALGSPVATYLTGAGVGRVCGTTYMVTPRWDGVRNSLPAAPRTPSVFRRKRQRRSGGDGIRLRK